MSNLSFYKSSLSPLPKNEEVELAKQAAAGNKMARETLIRANIRYALSYAKKFYGHGLSNEEVNEEAVIGLIKAIDHFDFTKGIKIITYARICIMNEIVTSCNKTGFAQQQCISLDDSTGSDFGDTKLSCIPDTESYTPEETAVYHLQKQQLYSNLDTLSPFEKQIICMHYGLKKYKQSYSLTEIGEKFGESKQYIHYIEQRALAKLKTKMNGLAG